MVNFSAKIQSEHRERGRRMREGYGKRCKIGPQSQWRAIGSRKRVFDWIGTKTIDLG